MMLRLLTLLTLCCGLTSQVSAQEPLRLEISDGVIEPMPIALTDFVPQESLATDLAIRITRLIAADLASTGLFREIPSTRHIGRVTNFSSPVQYADWKAINAQALITGSVSVQADRVVVQFRLFDVFAESQLGQGMQFAGSAESWRRLGHKVADAVYSRITGESGYFDSRVAFVSERGPKDARQKRLAIMDYDGANVQFLTGAQHLVLAPRFSPDGRQILYTSYETGFPRIYVMDIATLRRRVLAEREGNMSFAPRFSPDGQSVVFSAETSGNTDLFVLNLRTGASLRLTSDAAIETAPSFSPDGSQVVFESDRTGAPQIYKMSARGGTAQRVSRGEGRYGTPVWSPRGDLIAFTKQTQGRFHIGVMRTDGTEERLLTGAFLDEGPTWSPNGRVVMFTRETQGERGVPTLYSIDITGRNLRRIPTPDAGSDPAWSPLLP